MIVTPNREHWLQQAVAALRPIFATKDIVVPNVQVSCGFPKGNVRKVIGQCWPTSSAADGTAQVFVTPFLQDPIAVLEILCHELVHAADDCEHQHRGPFVKMIRALGLEGKPTATHAGEALRAQLNTVAEALGDYPHGALSSTAGEGAKKQGTRMLKVVCPEDGYTLRTTAKWIDVGLPSCPCGEVMELAQ